LRPDIWSEFRRRFSIPRIAEFYAATEGNVLLFNTDGIEGAIGRIPWFLAPLVPTKIIRLDEETQMPIRDARGLCIPCAPGDPGEAIGRILNDRSRPGARFEGYAAETDNQRKVLRDVFAPGDAWFRSGDLIRTDADGYFYFIDRIGDTFRWKGENVATSEVAEIISGFPGVCDACVYGIAVPGYDGRASMAALVVDRNFDLAEFRTFLAARLANFARPIFLRFLSEMPLTTTFKQKKIELVRDGADPSRVSGRVLFDDMRVKAYVPVSAELYQDIVSGRIRL
jgi:fatty-acyl-CoA synthase